MKRIAKFEKVSLKQFLEGCDRADAEEIYNGIRLPKRATAGSAGYDFFAPYDVKLAPGETVKHKVFGNGMIISSVSVGNDSLLEISFDSVGTKKIMANFAKLEKLE